MVAVDAFPVRAAVIVPAAKSPEASRATTLEAVLAAVASTVAVTAAEPLNLVPVKYVPNVSAFATEPAWPEMAPVTAEPLMAMVVSVTEVNCPWAFTANTGTAEAEPYVLAETVVLAMLNV